MRIEISNNLLFKIRKNKNHNEQEIFYKSFSKVLIYDEYEFINSENDDNYELSINKNSLILKSIIQNFINCTKNKVELIIILNDDISDLYKYQTYIESIGINIIKVSSDYLSEFRILTHTYNLLSFNIFNYRNSNFQNITNSDCQNFMYNFVSIENFENNIDIYLSVNFESK
jgi:hypothetical protein